MTKLLWALQGFDPRPLVRTMIVGFRKGWTTNRADVARFIPKRTLREQIKFRVMTYVMGTNPDTLLFFMKDQFTLAEVETLITSIPAGIGPIMLQRVQITTNVPSAAPVPSENGDVTVTAEPMETVIVS